MELEGREARRLGSLARYAGIDKAIADGAPSHSLWRCLLSAVREKVSLQGKTGMSPRQVDHYGEGNPVPEGISCTESDL